MNNKRIVSLLLSIIMVLQIIVPQVQVQAASGKTSVQMSEGKKIGKRSEVFTFKNTKKPRKSWFTMGTMSLNNATQVSITREETLKITTKATGLDNGKKQFDWAAFGQNKKFSAWIEVAYVEDKKPGEKVASKRHKVSEDFDISSEADIDAKVTLDSSKNVDYYYLMTEYDENDSLVKINAILDYRNSLSPRDQADLTFKIGIQQIVSTTITYNLIDEYGKPIDLNDAKEEKPADTDLANLAKFGNGTDAPLLTFNLKNKGTDILREEQIDDEDELIDSSIKLIVEKGSIKSNNIDYKLTSTYDVIKGGTVTIKRQKDVVTPKDPHNPGTTPEGYARLNLSADALGGKTDGTFTKDNPQDTQRVVDVKAGKAYTAAKAEVEKQGKPFPLTDAKKVDTGKTFDKWTPDLSTLGTAVAKETKNLNATYKSSDVEIIPYLPNEPVPDKDKDGLPIPTDYVTVTFKSESETKGKVKVGEKEGATVHAKVKPGIDLSKKSEITTLPEADYGFTVWKPVLGKAAEGQTYIAHFVKSGDEINEGDTIPKDWFKVKVSQDESIVDNTVVTKFYTVKPNGTLASDKFAKLDGKAKEGYKDPAWYVGSEKLEKPFERQITTYTEFLASATEEIANKFKNNPLKAVDITAYKGDKIEGKFWNKGVTTQREDAVLKRLIESANVTDTTNPARTTEKRGTFSGTLKVTFTDGSSLEVQNQKLIVIDTKVDIDYSKDSDKDANAPRHNDEVVKGKIKSDEALEGAKVEILDKDNKVIGITLAKADGSFIAGTRELQAGEKIKVRVTLPKADKASPAVEKVVKLNADRLKDLLPIAKAQKDNFSKKQNAIIKAKLETLGTAITEAEKLVDEKGKAKGEDTAKNQTAIDNAVTNLENALKALTANIPPTISGPKTHEIFVGEDLDLKALVDVTDGDGANDLVLENGSNVKITAVKVEGQTETPVAKLSTIKDNVGTYKVTYTVKDKAKAEVTHEMTLTVKPRTTSAIEVTKDPNKMSYLITEKDGKAKLDLTGMTLNLVDNLGKKTKVELTDSKVKFKVNGKEIKNGGDLTLEDDVKFIEVEYTPEGSQTPLKAQTKGVLRVGPDYDKDGTDDRTQNFDPKNIEKLEVIKQPQLDYIAKDKSEDSKFKLNLEGMIVRMTDKAGKEKLAVVSDGKFVEYDDTTKEIKGLTATPAHGAKLTPQTSDTDKGHNGSKVAITGPNNSKAETDSLKVFYDANKDGKPDYGQDQKTPAPSAMARNIGEDPKVTTVEGMATPDAVIKIYDSKDKEIKTEKPVVAGPDGKYTATVKPLQADGTEIKVTAKLGEMGESDPTPTKVFDDKNDNKQPDRDEGFNIAKATDIKFVDDPDLTYLVKTKDTEVTFNGKDGKGKPIYLELSYKNGEKTESKIMTLEDLMKDTTHIAVTPENGTKDKIENQTHELVGKAIEVKLKNVVEKQGATEDQKTAATATSTSKFAIEIDADGNGTADKDEKTPMPSILSARNIKEGNDVKTKVLVKGEPGATITIKSEDGQTTLGTGTVETTGEVEITLNPKQDAGKKVQAIAKLGEKKPSDPAESIVFDDLDNDGKPDGQGSVDFKNIVDMRIASDPKTMSYALASKDATKDLDLNGLTVYVKDKNGNTGIYQYGAEANKVNGVQFEELKGNANFKLELVDAKGENPAAITDQTTLAKANDSNKIKVSIANNVEKHDTTGPLNVFVDANGNGVDDDKEKIDLTKVKSIKVISQPELNYPITLADKGKKNLDLTKMVVAVSDGVTTANYTAEELLKAKIGEGNEAKDAFKLTLVDNADAKKADITTLKDTELTTANDQNKVKVALAAKDDVNDKTEALEVFEDLDGDGKRDTKQTPAPKDLKALNVKDDAFTTITGKAQKGDTLKVYGEDKKEILVDPSNISIDENGNFTIKVSKDGAALPKESLVFVTAQADKKDESPRTPVVVKVDKDGSGTADSDETTTITSVTARNIGTAGQDGTRVKATFTTIEGVAEKGSKVTITFTEKGKQKATTKTVDADANTGEYKLELNNPAILLDAETVVKASAKYGEKKDSPTIETKVFDDLNADGKDDKAAEQKSKMPQNVRAMNQNKVGQDGKVTNEAKDTTTVKGKVTPGAIVKITSEDGKTDLTPVGGITVDQDGNFTAEITKQDPKKIIKVTATEPGKLESDAAEATVFRDADNNEADDSKATTERPSALAYNFKDEAKTTIKGEAEPGATVVAKVDGTEVGRVTANAEGKYTIEATKDGAKLPKGTKVSVTAKLAPKGESPAQETVVYDDLDGDGQPDTSQAFDKTKIRGFEVVASPNKMVYNNKEQLDLTGMKVKLTDQMGNMKIVEFSEFVKYGITVSPVNNIELSDKEVADGGNNGQKIKAEVKVTIDNNQVTYPGETPTALTVNKDQSAKPTDVTAANQGDDNFTKVRFKAADGAKIKIYKADDAKKTNLINGTLVAGTGKDAGYLIATLNTKLPEGTLIEITSQETGKSESSPEEAKVVRDKNGDWKDDAGNIKLTAPDFEDVKVGDKSVKVEIPTDPSITKIIVQDQAGNEVEATKEMEGEEPNKKAVWKVNGKPVEKDGKLDITTDPTLKFGSNQIVKVIVKDAENNEGSKTKAVQPANLPKMPDPIPDSLSTQDTKVTGKSVPGAIVKVQLPGQTEKEAQEALVKSDGSFEFVLPNKLADKDKVIIIAESPGKYQGIGKATVTVGLNLKELENTNREADKLISDSKTGNNFDPENNKYDKNLEEKSKKAKDVLEKAKDKDDNNDPTQTKVDEAEKELRKAIAEKIADTAVDKAKDNPTPENIKDAQDKIDAIPGSTEPNAKDYNSIKKELQDKLDLIEKIKEGEDRLKQDDVTGKEGVPQKPGDLINDLKKAVEEGKDALNKEEKMPEATEKIDDALKKIDMERIKVGVNSLGVGLETLEIRTSVPDATVIIKIDNVVIDTITTSAYGTFSKGLREGLKAGQRVILEASKPGYNDGKYRETVK